jgi:hypothetical protein
MPALRASAPESRLKGWWPLTISRVMQARPYRRRAPRRPARQPEPAPSGPARIIDYPPGMAKAAATAPKRDAKA